MIRTRFKKVLLVAPAVLPDQLLTDYKNVKHVSTLTAIFPSIYELNPNVIVFDYDFMGNEMEKIVRRIKINKFYSKLKICCYKSVPNDKTDSLLKALGVDTFIYHADLEKSQKSTTIISSFNTLVDSSLMKLVGSVSN
jgi:hypothetical protein